MDPKKQMNKQNKNRLTNTENRLVFAIGEGDEETGEIGEVGGNQ